MTDDLMAWLGPAAADLTPEQIDRVRTEAAAIRRRYPDPDEQPERDAALSAVVQYLLGEFGPGDAARALIDARRREQEAVAAATWVGVMLVREGAAKTAAAAAAGIDRMTLLKALGER
ncbi:MAG TPA: hypothetical protein VFU47_07005, partial [Armatimonadota bacterium]|nr:hypothetical protein [Armatimonadota bacterium]